MHPTSHDWSPDAVRRGAPYGTLFSNIDTGHGLRVFYSSGASGRGAHCGAMTTFWNIRAQRRRKRRALRPNPHCSFDPRPHKRYWRLSSELGTVTWYADIRRAADHVQSTWLSPRLALVTVQSSCSSVSRPCFNSMADLRQHRHQSASNVLSRVRVSVPCSPPTELSALTVPWLPCHL